MAYKLCKYNDGINSLRDIRQILTNTKANPYPVRFQNGVVVGEDLRGAPIRAGLPRLTWHWDWLRRADYGILLDYVGLVYIETVMPNGNSARFRALMSIPEEPETLTMSRCGPVDVLFTMLIEVA